jgi:hypothetical protein
MNCRRNGWEGTPSTRRKPVTVPLYVHRMFLRPDPDSNPSHSGEKAATDRVNHGVAKFLRRLQNVTVPNRQEIDA